MLAALAVAVLAVSVSVVAAPAPATAASSAPLSWLRTSGSKIIHVDSGNTVRLRATSWFGMETDTCAPHGLWSITLDQGMSQIAGMGFNAVRLPFSNECLAKKRVNSINTAINPKLANASTLQVMDAVIASARKYGLRIILDRHRPDSAAQSELWYTSRYSEARWIADWKMLAKRYKHNSTVTGFDLHNEPRGNACWGCGVRSRDWRAAAIRAGNEILKVNARLLIIVEGVQNEEDGSVTWWGGGLRGAAKKPVTLNVRNRVVYSPHEYPVSVAYQPWFSAKNYPANLPGVWERNWGYLVSKNIAPVLVGEFGTKLETTSDKRWLSAFVKYLDRKNISFAYWSFNPNSGDTGGLLEDDWYTRQTAKLSYLRPLLTPKKVAYPKAPVTPTPAPNPSPTPAPSQSPAPGSDPSVGKSSTATSRWTTAKMTVTSAWEGAYQVGLTVTAPKTRKVKSWRASWVSPGATSIDSAWGMDCTLTSAGAANAKVTCAGKNWGLDNLTPGARVDVGVIIKAPKGPNPPKLSLTAT
ncbi:cellulase family glycosylhydrolase [Microbacterium dauci]|uniref:Endoglucanase n=1 Tax=Microbacterium dauci TaxID=3048008 RepID=A0ABT6ZED2_9MICO|nr:cellulase family glycosylhydrolase [Microbacterium sp. LX3-4]MDJ1114509.1 cellulase family glycosylhydrolase [Microbacterium sp. LX3-4]